mmetsp:Transcript_19508/g.23378  ORF Transcript_19508/g.23378 Transcript_19508/m.23378 type:complete len:444 (+) Transcript_19508:191-1522(+)
MGNRNGRQKQGDSKDTACNAASRAMAVKAKDASRALQALPPEERTAALHRVADALLAEEAAILAENAADVAKAEKDGTEAALLNRLKLKPGKIQQLVTGIRSIAEMDDPIDKVVGKTMVAEGLQLDQVTCSLGVLLIIFESRPDALPQIASLAIKSGNGLLLKGGKEASRSNAKLHSIISEALKPTVDPGLLALVTTREGVDDLLKLDDVVDLVIPRGSNALVKHIQNNTKIPVMGHADGVCHVYIDKAADLEKAKKIAVDSKIDYPAACNAMETLLVHSDIEQAGGLKELMEELSAAGVEMFGGPTSGERLGLTPAPAWRHEYGNLGCTVEVVASLEDAINHIHTHGSSHTECIVTEDTEAVEAFIKRVDSACVFHNASTRFSDGFRFGLGAEVGVSTGRIHARGPVGVNGLLTTKWQLRGNGHTVEKDEKIKYLHKTLPSS